MKMDSLLCVECLKMANYMEIVFRFYGRIMTLNLRQQIIGKIIRRMVRDSSIRQNQFMSLMKVISRIMNEMVKECSQFTMVKT